MLKVKDFEDVVVKEDLAVMGEAQAWDLMQGTRNYASVYDLLEAAEEEIGRYVQKGFAVIRDGQCLRERFGSGTISRMALIQKQKDDGRVKNRLIVDMLRSGGNARATVTERLVLPRVSSGQICKMPSATFRWQKRKYQTACALDSVKHSVALRLQGRAIAHGQTVGIDFPTTAEPLCEGRRLSSDLHG
jgi:hypothetical protein